MYKPTTRRKPVPKHFTLDQRIDYHVSNAKRVGDCLIADTWLSHNGHPRIAYRGKKKYFLTRLILERKIGRKLLPNEHSCHTCDVPACINEDHLWVGTAKENIRDCVSKGRIARGAKQGLAKLTEPDVVFIRQSTLPGTELAIRFGVSESAISCVRLRKTWGHV